MSNLSAIPLTTIDGQQTDLSHFAGEVLLVVNVASRCGLTPQYTALEALYQRYKARGFRVLGFPANDFAGQEPGTDAEIATFCSVSFPVTFPLFSKVVATGEGKHPLYAALIAARPQREGHGNAMEEQLASYAVKNNLPAPNAPPELLWNFEKFLVNRNGEVVARFAPDVTPDDPLILEQIESALNAS